MERKIINVIKNPEPAHEPDELITWVYRWMDNGKKKIRISTALQELVMKHYFKN